MKNELWIGCGGHGWDDIAEQKRRNCEVFQETLEICRKGEYVSEHGRKVTLPPKDCVSAASKWYDSPPSVDDVARTVENSVAAVREDCILVARELKGKGYNPILLNMASRGSPGGGVLSGARAQEESLCRQSTLVESLYSFEPELAKLLGLPLGDGRYPMNRNTGGIYSGGITFFRGSVREGYRLWDEPFECAVVSVAGVNRPELDANGRLTTVMVRVTKGKMRSILRIGLLNGHDAIVLGALGCGAFHNPPDHIAELFREVLGEEEFKDKYRCVRFAIIEDHNSHNANFAAFAKVFN